MCVWAGRYVRAGSFFRNVERICQRASRADETDKQTSRRHPSHSHTERSPPLMTQTYLTTTYVVCTSSRRGVTPQGPGCWLAVHTFGTMGRMFSDGTAASMHQRLRFLLRGPSCGFLAASGPGKPRHSYGRSRHCLGFFTSSPRRVKKC